MARPPVEETMVWWGPVGLQLGVILQRISNTAPAPKPMMICITKLEGFNMRAYSILVIITRNFKFLDKDSFLVMYKSMVRSHLEYNIMVGLLNIAA